MSGSFLKRSGAMRSYMAEPFFEPEIGPHDGMKGVLLGADMQNSQLVRLGPHTYTIYESMVVPDNVVLVGVPNVTKIVKVINPKDSAKGFGPVVTLGAGSQIRDCQVDLQLDSVTAATSGGGLYVDRGVSKFNDGSGGVTTFSSSGANSVIHMSGQHGRVLNCYIPEGRRRSIYISESNCFATGNRLEDDTNVTTSNDCVYVEDAKAGTVAVGNWCRSLTNGVISFQVGMDQAIPVNGNYALISIRV